MHFQKEFYPHKYLNNNDFPLLLFGFIRMKVDTTTFKPGCCDVVHYKVIKKNYVKTTYAAKSSFRLDFNKTRNLINTFRVQNSLAN